jgi:hypothetical protein
MEYATVDVDPSLPDAATTIIRIYNRAMRRWDNLYLNNRSNGLFYFGGVKENDKIILTNFVDHRGLASMNRYVFYDIKSNTDYKWYSDVSYNGGKSFIRFWEILVTKK